MQGHQVSVAPFSIVLIYSEVKFESYIKSKNSFFVINVVLVLKVLCIKSSVAHHKSSVCVRKAWQLTQQDEDAGQDGDERSSAEACRQTVRLGVARHDVTLVVAAAHVDGQRAGARLDRLLSIRDENGQVVDGLVL